MPIFNGVVKRTLNLPKKALERYKVGETIEFRGLTSSTYGETIEIENNINVVLTIKSKDGRLIESISRFEREKEVLFFSFSKFEVDRIDKIGDIHYFELKQL